MAKDKNDDPFAPPPRDATIFRPRPGIGKRGSEAAAPAEPRASNPIPVPSPSAFPSAARSASPGAVRDFSASGLNPLLQAASPLLVLAGRLRTTLSQTDVAGLRRQTLNQMREFEERARQAGVQPETIMAARYVLCTAVDEAVLSTPWARESEWREHSLLVTLHHDNWGGKKFFEMLEAMLPDTTRHIYLLEVQYVCLALGFAGMYHVAERGHLKLAEIQSDLFRRIRAFRGVPPPELSLQWRGMQDRRNPLIRYVPWWVIGAFTLVVITGAFIFFHVRLNALAAPVDDRLAHLGSVEPPASVAPPTGSVSVAPRLRQLLQADVTAGVLSVEERGNQTVVTLIASDLFGSGSAAVNPKYADSLSRLAHALNEVPGRVFVIGHTDDQPVKSLRFRDNYDLSRARADAVDKMLAGAMDDPGRLEPSGVGSSEPRYKPESLPENRARNRRVEIVHVGDG